MSLSGQGPELSQLASAKRGPWHDPQFDRGEQVLVPTNCENPVREEITIPAAGSGLRVPLTKLLALSGLVLIPVTPCT